MDNFDIEGDLNRWMPILLRLWRAQAGFGASDANPNRLTQQEMAIVVSAVRRLTRGFAGNGPITGERYLDDPTLLGAYLLYFWPVSYVQARYCLHAAGLSKQDLSTANCLDLGCGPAPMSAALLDMGAQKNTAADHSKSALKIANTILRHTGRSINLAVWDAAVGTLPGAGPYDCIVIGHTLNELWRTEQGRVNKRAHFVSEVLRSLTDRGVVLIVEPAFKSTSRDLLALRDELSAQGAQIIAPCYFKGPCPALADPNGMCHASYRWKIPQVVSEIADAAGPDKNEIKMSYLCIGPAMRKKESAEQRYRVVSDHMVNKAGRHRILLCGAEGRFSLSVKKGEGYQAEKGFFALQRGMAARVTGMELRGGNRGVGNNTQIFMLG